MKSSFGNYVVQKALMLSSGFIKVKLINNIKKNIDKFNDIKMVIKWETVIANSTANKLKLVKNYDGYCSGDSVKSNDSMSSYNSKNTNISSSVQRNTFSGKMYPSSGGNSPNISETFYYPIRYPSDDVIYKNLKNFK